MGFDGSVPEYSSEQELRFAGGEVEDLFSRFSVTGGRDSGHRVVFDEFPVHGRLVEAAHGRQLEGVDVGAPGGGNPDRKGAG